MVSCPKRPLIVWRSWHLQEGEFQIHLQDRRFVQEGLLSCRSMAMEFGEAQLKNHH
jgi:hypothetical protein